MKNYFEHSLDTRTIVIRQDDSESVRIENNVGKIYPLVRIRNTVMGFMEIVSFELTINEYFLPMLSISIDDSKFAFRQLDFAKGIDLITIFIGNAQDTTYKPIKNDYVITEVASSPGSAIISFEAMLHVPGLYNADNTAFENITSFDMLKIIAQEIGLGFVSNVSNTNDEMNRIRFGNTWQFIEDTVKFAYKDSTCSFLCFIDQWSNLCFIDVNTAINESPSTYMETNLLTGVKLEEPKLLKLTNNKMSIDENTVKISHFTPVSSYGAAAAKRATTLSYITLASDLATESLGQIQSNVIQLQNTQRFSRLETSNAFKEFSIAEAVNKTNNAKIQGMTIECLLDQYVPPIFMYGSFDVEILNSPERSGIESQSTTESNDDLLKEKPAIESRRYTLNEALSGEALLTKMSITYSRVQNRDGDAIGKIRQNATFFSKNQSPMTFIS